MSATPPSGLSEPAYEQWAQAEIAHWREQMLRGPGGFDRMAKGVQRRITALIPERVHAAVTRVIEQLTRGVLTGSGWTTSAPLREAPLSARDARARSAIAGYRTTAAVEGGVAGAGGFVLAAADFPALIAIKMKLLFDLAAIYGRDTDDVAERIFLLHIFQLAFSSAEKRAEAFHHLANWDEATVPHSLEDFDWRTFQQEYRDYIDLAKLAQLIPVVGAPIGAVVNWRLTARVGEFAINAYRMRSLAR